MEEEKNILDSAAYKKSPFSTPENYFSDFSNNLENKIILMNSKKEVSLFVKMKPWIYIAASFLIFVGGIRWYISGMVNVKGSSAENTEMVESPNAEATILYTYLDDLAIMNYLVSDDE